MLAEQLIVDEIPALQISDTGDTALRWMDEFKVSHLSVVEGNTFLGSISEDDILNQTDVGEPISSFREALNPAFVSSNQHVFDAVKAVNNHQLSVVPVTDGKSNYLGCISVDQLMKVIADMPMANHPGAIIVLELAPHQYSLHNIARIIEEEHAQILGTFITSSEDSNKIDLTIKLNKTETSSIISSLQRHDYTISFFENDQTDDDDLNDRFDALMSYLNV